MSALKATIVIQAQLVTIQLDLSFVPVILVILAMALAVQVWQHLTFH